MVSSAALIPLGWNPKWQSVFDEASFSSDSQLARVVRQDRGAVTVVSDSGSEMVRLAGKAMGTVLVGDWVAVRDGSVAGVLPRASLLERKDVNRDATQHIVANIDVVNIVCGLDRPLSQRRIERAITQTRQSGATPLVVLTKHDLVADQPSKLVFLDQLDVPFILVSVRTHLGFDDLEHALAGTTSVFIGESGAGKSSLTNALLGDEVVRTGDVRQKEAAGKHTTTRRELHVTSFGIVIDTPGIRSLGLWADEPSVASAFPDIAEIAEHCRFSDCAHAGEPGCAVAEAMADGSLEEPRVDAWLRQLSEVRDNETAQIMRSRRRSRRNG